MVKSEQRVLFYMIVVLLAISRVTFASSNNDDFKLILDHADTVRSEGSIRYLIGNVKVHRKDMVILADNAYFNGVTGIIDLNDDVKLMEPGQVLTTLRIVYNDFSGDYDALGEVHFVKQDSIEMECRTAKFTAVDSLLQLVDDVVINDLNNNTTVTGKRARWFESEKKALITGNPVYRLPDEKNSSADTLIIKSQFLL